MPRRGAPGRSSAGRYGPKDRSLGADVLSTSECGHGRFKATPPCSPLAPLADDAVWFDAVERFRARNPRRLERIAEYDALLAAGEQRRIADAVLSSRHRPEPPAETWRNKADGRKKRVFRYPPPDELLFRVVNRLVQPLAEEAASPWCRSFLPGGGARATFSALLSDRRLAELAAARLDVRDYFNSIDVEELLAGLPGPFTSGPLGALLRASLTDARVVRDGAVVHDPHKGVMAGTPIAPVLATLHLADLDIEVAGTGAAYARYSDDIIVLAPPDEVRELDALVRQRLAERGLEINESKSSIAGPGEPWDFLGFRHDRGSIGLAPITVQKAKAKATRSARALLRWRERTGATPERAVRAYLRRTNRRLYGIATERASFSWATWFLPLLDRTSELQLLDEHVQREARFVATGRRTASTRSRVPYDALVAQGHLPLVTAYWASKQGCTALEELVGRRTGLAGRASGGGELLGDDARQLGAGGLVDAGALQHDPLPGA